MTTSAVVRNSCVHKLRAAEIDQEYRLFVQLPPQYAESDGAYPVLYLLDGDQFFGMVTDTVRLLQHARELPDLIIVGIGYGTDTSQHFVQRMRDYAPSTVEEFPYAGGAEPFRRCLINQVMPFINTTYRTDGINNTLIGASISGLFALYTILQRPSPFNSFLVSSPSLPWDDHLISKMEADYAQQHADLAAKLFLSVGGLEGMVDDVNVFAATLTSRNYNGFSLHTVTIADETHFSVQPAAFARGLHKLYADAR